MTPRHLRWATCKENHAGQRHSRAKLTEQDVGLIRDFLEYGERHTEIARKFHVSPTAIDNIASGRTWNYQPELVIHGISPRGEKKWKAKLTERDVSQIKYLITNGEKQRAIAQKFGVHFGTINDIARDKTWRHIAGTDKIGGAR